jgi:hypothetical protein
MSARPKGKVAFGAANTYPLLTTVNGILMPVKNAGEKHAEYRQL